MTPKMPTNINAIMAVGNQTRQAKRSRPNLSVGAAVSKPGRKRIVTLLACALLVNPIHADAAPHMAYGGHAEEPLPEQCLALFDVLAEHGIIREITNGETGFRIRIGKEEYRRLEESIKDDLWTCFDAFSGEGLHQESDPSNWPLAPEEEL